MVFYKTSTKKENKEMAKRFEWPTHKAKAAMRKELKKRGIVRTYTPPKESK